MTGVVCVSRRLGESAEALGVDPGRIYWCPAFLPPDLVPADRTSVAPEVWGFVESRRPLIAANGKVLWYNREDLYGLDQLVDLAARLKEDHPRVGVVVCFWDHSPEDESYLDQLKGQAAKKGVEKNILFNTRSGVFVPILAVANLFVRPTNTDGDACSVREALYLGVPVVASDAAERPPGAILFRTRDLDDFESKVRSVLESPRRQSDRRPGYLSPEDQMRIDTHVELLASVAEGRES